MGDAHGVWMRGGWSTWNDMGATIALRCVTLIKNTLLHNYME